MPSLDDNIEDLASSADPTLDEVAGADAGKTDAASSPAEGESDENELLNVVRDVVKDRETSEAASPAEGEKVQDQDQAGKEPDDENFSDVPFNKHPRFQQLLRKAKTFEEGAKRYENVERFLDNVGLSGEEAAEALEIGGLMKSNPVEAWNRLKPTIQKLLIAVGEVVPQDLADRVQRGEISDATAREISRERAKAASVAAKQQFDTEMGQRRTERTLQSGIDAAVTAWEADRTMKDPNYAAKQPRLMEKIAFLQRTEGVPRDANGVKDQLKRAYEAVNKEFVAPVAPPQKRPIAPVMGGQKAGNQGADTASMSTLDIVRANVRRA